MLTPSAYSRAFSRPATGGLWWSRGSPPPAAAGVCAGLRNHFRAETHRPARFLSAAMVSRRETDFSATPRRFGRLSDRAPRTWEDRGVSEHVPFVIIGGGVMGLSTAWALTRRGERPLVLEQFARGHTRGASHGATRNFNNAYADEHYLDLLVRAREGWEALGEPGGEPLLRLHGLFRTVAALRWAAPEPVWSPSTSSCEPEASRSIFSTMLKHRGAGRASASRTPCCSRRMPVSPVRRSPWRNSSAASSRAAARSAGRLRRSGSKRMPTASRCRRLGVRCAPTRSSSPPAPGPTGSSAAASHSRVSRHRGEPRAFRPARPRRHLAVVQSLRDAGHLAGECVWHADPRRGREGGVPCGRRRGRS